MKEFRLRTDLQRVTIKGFALPLGIQPLDQTVPVQGYTLAYLHDDQGGGEDNDPQDTYTFHVVVSHEKVAPILHKAFELLPDEVCAIVEIGSRDAYRATDTFLSQEPLTREEFLHVWNRYEPFLLEDGSIAAGCNSEEPFIEVFMDQWKGIFLHVPLSMREEVEAMLHAFGLDEVPETWPDMDDSAANTTEDTTVLRPVLDLSTDDMPDVDDLLMSLRQEWNLELNVDPDSNVDDAGRNLGATLWHAVVILESAAGNPSSGAYASVWGTARSLAHMESLIRQTVDRYPQYVFGDLFTIDRVAYDERPDALSDLPPRLGEPRILLVDVDPWNAAPRSEDPSRGDTNLA